MYKRQRQHRADTFQQSVVTAVHMDEAINKRRGNIFIIAGLAPSETVSDVELLTDWCAAKFNVQPDIVSVERLAHLQMGRVQSLLVYLKQADQAKQLVSSTRQLRR